MIYTPRFRVVPQDGAETVYTFAAFASTNGPAWNRVRYAIEKTSRMSVNWNIVERRFGARSGVDLRFEAITLVDEAILAAIASSMLRDDVEVYFSNDGGTTERRVFLASDYRREPLGGKTLAGVTITMRIEVLDLIAAVPQGRPLGVTQW